MIYAFTKVHLEPSSRSATDGRWYPDHFKHFKPIYWAMTSRFPMASNGGGLVLVGFRTAL